MARLTDPLLNVRDVRKAFGATVAMDGDDFDLLPGEVPGTRFRKS